MAKLIDITNVLSQFVVFEADTVEAVVQLAKDNFAVGYIYDEDGGIEILTEDGRILTVED